MERVTVSGSLKKLPTEHEMFVQSKRRRKSRNQEPSPQATEVFQHGETTTTKSFKTAPSLKGNGSSFWKGLGMFLKEKESNVTQKTSGST
mmetsp:Transcript_3587/g.5106  ORF Transcript_3587/g.5106 Transcript_3587/m.5106 type:complete len:90 (-) Transcript_3587:1235-1504(-)